MAIAEVDRERINADIDAQYAAEKRASETVPGWNIEPTPAQRVLDDLLTLVVSHDRVCQWYERFAYDYYGMEVPTPRPQRDDAPFTSCIYEMIELCARVAPAAMRRIPELAVWQKAATRYFDHLASANDDELRELLFPIFEESGIPERYLSTSEKRAQDEVPQ